MGGCKKIVMVIYFFNARNVLGVGVSKIIKKGYVIFEWPQWKNIVYP